MLKMASLDMIWVAVADRASPTRALQARARTLSASVRGVLDWMRVSRVMIPLFSLTHSHTLQITSSVLLVLELLLVGVGVWLTFRLEDLARGPHRR